ASERISAWTRTNGGAYDEGSSNSAEPDILGCPRRTAGTTPVAARHDIGDRSAKQVSRIHGGARPHPATVLRNWPRSGRIHRRTSDRQRSRQGHRGKYRAVVFDGKAARRQVVEARVSGWSCSHRG